MKRTLSLIIYGDVFSRFLNSYSILLFPQNHQTDASLIRKNMMIFEKAPKSNSLNISSNSPENDAYQTPAWLFTAKHFYCEISAFPVGIYMFKVNNRNSITRCEICSKLTIKTPERRHWRRSGVFIVNFEHISHLVLVFLLLTLNM